LWDSLVGAILTSASFNLKWVFATIASLCVYHAGMLANDLADRDLDRIHRPNRPLASGKISILSASILLCCLLAGAVVAASFSTPSVLSLIKGLCLLVLIYNFGGKPIRKNIGPALLAAARGASLFIGGLALLPVNQLMNGPILWAAACYAMYFLFLSRLATNEEEGASGMRILALNATAACAPVLLLKQSLLPGLIPSLAWSFLLTRHVITLRHQQLSPSQVQAIVRKLLAAAPLLLSIALIHNGFYYQATGGPIVSLLIGWMAQRIPPE